MSDDSSKSTLDTKKVELGKNRKPMLSTTPSLPKEEPKKKLGISQETALQELESLRRALREEKSKSKEYIDRLKYLQADFENSAKRLRREAEEAVILGNEQLIIKILDVAENLDRAVEACGKISEKSELATGVKMISKQLNEILKQEGLEKIPSEGTRFNPALHEAVAQTETEEKAEGTVLKELKRGYILKGRILRPSKVEVAKKPVPKE